MFSGLVLTFVSVAGLVQAAPGSAPSSWGEWSYTSYPTSHGTTYPSSVYTPPATTQTPTSSGVVSVVSPTLTTASSTSASALPSPTDACGSVRVLAASILATSPKALPTVPAQLAYECLNSIPFNRSAALQYLDSIDPYLNWQTTLEYVRDPPATYAENVQPPYDFYATWEAIKANVSAGAYQSEYQFGWTVYRAAQLVHDGHFVFYPDSVTAIFSFGRRTPLVSVSLDGHTPPQPYVYADILAASKGATFIPSPVKQIDGQDAIEYLLNWSEYGSLQDPDALYNNLFWEPAQVALGSSGTGTGTFSGGGRGRWPYPGPSTTLTFANGSSNTQNNFARVLQPFDNITSGADIYKYFLIPPPEAYQNPFEYASSTLLTTATSTPATSASSAAATSSTPTSTPTPAPGYPAPFVQEMSNLNGGYFIDAPGYEDVAVLVVRSFVGTTPDEIPFQAVNTYFIETAAAMGKTKLIIDVSANGGGTILQGYDLFKQLFPSILPYGATRFAAHEAFNLLGEQSSYIAGLYPRSLNNTDVILDIESSAFNYRTDADVNYQPFTSWQEKYGPVALGPDPDNFTSIIRWNLSDVLTPLNSGGIEISGYGNRTNITSQPFASENIVILTDGYCASTCTIFAELMVQQGHVKTVSLGGRPNGNKISQAVGGVKGTNDFPFDYIYGVIAEVFSASNSSLQSEWETTVLDQYSALPLYRSTAVVVNARNGYRQNDPDQIPLQFVYEPADCRILYTPAMILDETAVWKTVADSVWGGGAGNACVAGGFGASAKRGEDAVEVEKRALHRASQDLDYDAILDSFELYTENEGLRDGDSIMIP